MLNKPFSYGWGMVTLAAVIPIIFSVSAGLSIDGLSINELSSHVSFRSYDDMSYIFSYFSFGTMHIILCISVTFYVYDIMRNSSSVFIYRSFIKNHSASFLAASLIFSAIVIFFDTPLKRLSCDILWIGLNRISSNSILFESIFQIKFSYLHIDFKIFNIIPISLVVAAFLPASAIMMTVPHMVAKMDVNPKLNIEEIAESFLKNFDIVYYMMVSILISSSIATYLYLRTSYASINEKLSFQYSNLVNSVFSMWCIVYFLILLSVLLVSYAMVSIRISKASRSVDIIIDTRRLADVRALMSIHFMIKRKSSLFASSFSPIILLFLKNAVS